MSTPHSSAQHGGERIQSLDGLRGMACLVVLFYHLFMMLELWGKGAPYSLIPGTASVMVFFALSGVVLSIIPFEHLRGKTQYDWLRYYPRRIIRLAIPTFTAIAMGIVSGFIAWRLGSQSRSALAVDYNGGIQKIVHDVLMQFDLLFNVSDGMTTLSGALLLRADSPVWSMTWEMLFSITLPVAVYCVARVHKDVWLTVALTAAIWVSYASGYFPLRLCLMFWLGVILAKHCNAIATYRIPIIAEIALFFIIIVCIELPEAYQAVPGFDNPLIFATLATVMNLACMALVALAMSNGLLRKLLSTRPVRFLGQISFSLYLTHAILFGGFAVLLPKIGIHNGWAQSLIALVTAFVFAWLFYLIIERPSMHWSRALGHITVTL